MFTPNPLILLRRLRRWKWNLLPMHTIIASQQMTKNRPKVLQWSEQDQIKCQHLIIDPFGILSSRSFETLEASITFEDEEEEYESEEEDKLKEVVLFPPISKDEHNTGTKQFNIRTQQPGQGVNILTDKRKGFTKEIYCNLYRAFQKKWTFWFLHHCYFYNGRRSKWYASHARSCH